MDNNQSHYFSYNGRIPRSKFWYYPVFSILFFTLFVVLLQTENEQLQAIAVLMYIFIPFITAYIFSFPIVKRFHDINYSGWFYWLLVIPGINILIILILTFVKGTKGENKYGPDLLNKL